MKNIVFYSNFFDIKKGSGSGPMRCNQIYYFIKDKIKDVSFECKLKNIKNSYVICVKNNHKLDLNKLKELKNNNNKVIFDILDYYDVETSLTPDIVKNGFINYIDYFIVNNEFMKHEYEKYNKPIFVIYHHYDVRLNNISMPKLNELKFIFNGYVGDKNKNCLYINELKEQYGLLICDEFNKFKMNFLASNYCFISIREEGSWEYNNRPLMKLAHAAACDSNIVITNDMSVRDLLPSNYPYLLKDHNLETVLKMMDYVKETFETDVWYLGLEIMKEMKKKFHITNIINEYYVPMIKKL